MKTFELRGIAEGILGRSSAQAASFQDLLSRHPELDAVREKLILDGNIIKGFAPCDG